MTRIVSWNVNGLRAALRNGFLEWLASDRPDILCLQETRAMPGEIDAGVFEALGYRLYWNPARKPGYSGTALFAKKPPVSVTPFGVEEFDNEGRIQMAEYKDFTLINAYFPNSQPERARIAYKLAFCESLRDRCVALRKAGRHVLLCGDYNIAHTEIDLARPKENVDNPGFLPEERAAMDAFLAAGHVDTFRHFCKEPGHYTWWSYRGRAREKNIGWRLDYHCVDADFLPRVKSSSILKEITGSDHCPVAVEIR
ncbi:MAG TPA: exodeoxyribonuclease III [Candidatus Hydrogenedentes bacterium]|nr:exodeoxyribonuclease III [Candidatus Hydrogenedentota bacterium]HRT19709.1 exodeoxyribonuclease III [Candidatus Hydrogenedentota bacterium]HRT64483.1 exodeoxyribonuclease III [Candidatus Hydrogenedentota bacterium]